MVTKEDERIAALVLRNSEASHGANVIAAHREAAAKASEQAVLAKLRDLPREMRLVFSDAMHKADTDLPWHEAVQIGMTALADALESKQS